VRRRFGPAVLAQESFVLKRTVFAIALLLGLAAGAAAATDVNVADEAALEQIKGIGPARARAIVAERQAHGPYLSADDLAARVKGLSARTVDALRAQGLTVGAAPPPRPAASGVPRAKARAGAPPAR
jgi:competence protein ComEA